MACFLLPTLTAQRTVYGTVTDAGGTPLVGAYVYGVGTTAGTAADLDGYFELQLPAAVDTLTVSYLGYQTALPAVPTRGDLEVVLSPGAELPSVEVIAYRRVDVCRCRASCIHLLPEKPVPADTTRASPLALSSVYPNPSTGPVMFRTQLSRPTVVHLQLFDLNGRPLRDYGAYRASATRFDRSLQLPAGLPDGAYVLRATLADGTGVSRTLIKE